MSDGLWQLEFCPFTAEHVAQILAWQYEPPYDIYNMGTGADDPNELTEAIEYFLQPDYHFQAVLRLLGAEMLAFCSFGSDGQVAGGDYSAAAVDIGMGVRPDLTGRGLGEMFVAVAIDYAQKQFAISRLRVTIAEFNHRAQKVWRRHGFVPVQQFHSNFGERPFIIYVRDI